MPENTDIEKLKKEVGILKEDINRLKYSGDSPKSEKKSSLIDDDVKEFIRDAETQNLHSVLETIEKELILKALERNRWRRDKTAAALGITAKTLYRRIKQFNISEPGH